MKKMAPVMQREMIAFFYSPIAYAVLTIFLLTTGVFFVLLTFEPGNEASLRSLFMWMPIILAIFLPMLTMRLLSEEFRGGTIETLMTAPVGEPDVIMGKFLGATFFYMVMLASMAIYAVVIAWFGRLDPGLLLCSYIGLLLLGGLYISVGLFFSACTRNQAIAAIFSVVLLLIFTLLIDLAADKAEEIVRPFLRLFGVAESGQAAWVGNIKLVLRHLSISQHYQDFIRGLLDVNHLTYFITTTGLFLFLAVKVLESRRWR